MICPEPGNQHSRCYTNFSCHITRPKRVRPPLGETTKRENLGSGLEHPGPSS